jgi:hypothetical protein
VTLVKTNRRIDNASYQQAFGVSKPTATRDLDDLVRKGVLDMVGRTGKGTFYVVGRKGLTKGSKGSAGKGLTKGSKDSCSGGAPETRSRTKRRSR